MKNDETQRETLERRGMRRETESENGEEMVGEYYAKYSATLIFCFISNRRDKVKKFSPTKRKRCCFRSFGDSVFLYWEHSVPRMERKRK